MRSLGAHLSLTAQSNASSKLRPYLVDPVAGNCCRFRNSLIALILGGWLAGCATPGERVADGDNDGIADAVDRCRDTKAGHPVNATGCDVFSGVLSDVVFPPGRATLNAKARAALDVLIAELDQHPSVVLAVDAHTDNRGKAAENLQLSKLRVMSVVRYLVLGGIDGRRLRPFGYGESRPVVSNATEEGRRVNRRIEISVFELLPSV